MRSFRVVVLVFLVTIISGPFSGNALESLPTGQAAPTTGCALITPLLSQVAAGGGARDIKVMPDGTRKMRCPACGDYHLDVPADVPETEPIPPVPVLPPPAIGVPFDSPEAATSDWTQPPSVDAEGEESTPGSSTGTAAIAATSSLATAGIAALGAGLMMFGMGVTPREILDAVNEWIKSSPQASPTFPPDLDEFEQWRRCHSSRGWRYSESDGIAQFVPVEGATDERGWAYSEERGEFVAPGESHQPPPLPNASDLAYREEVRLMQEDLKRHQDLLNRERERLASYKEAGLDPLGRTKQRIREYEELVKLSQTELKRLNESTSVGSSGRQPVLEPNLKAEAAERVRTRETIDQLIDSEIAVRNSKLRLSGSPLQVGRFKHPPSFEEGEGI